MESFLEVLFENLAEKEHERWASWQAWMHSVCTKNPDGSLTIPKDKVERWERQIKTKYQDLTEEEKKSDREQVKRYFQLILNVINLARM